MGLQNGIQRPYRWEQVYDHLRGRVGKYASMEELLSVLKLSDTRRDQQVVRSTIPRIKAQAQSEGLVCVNQPGTGYALVKPEKRKKVTARTPQGGPPLLPEPDKKVAKKAATKKAVAKKADDEVLYGGKVEAKPAEPQDSNGKLSDEALPESILDEVLAADPEKPPVADEAAELPNPEGGDYEALYQQYGEVLKRYREMDAAYAQAKARIESLRGTCARLNGRVTGQANVIQSLREKQAEMRKLLDDLVGFAENLDIRLVGGWKNTGAGHHRAE